MNPDARPDEDAVLHELIDRLNRGDERAVREVFETYTPLLRMVVRRRLSSPLRSKLDSEDIVQSVWADLVDVFREGGDRFPDEIRLRAFLVRAARNRLVDRQRRHQTALERERPADDLSHEFASTRPADRPSQAIQADELWDRILALCPSRHRPMLRMKRDGVPLAEIATQTGMHPSSVRRVFYELASKLGAENLARLRSFGADLLGGPPAAAAARPVRP